MKKVFSIIPVLVILMIHAQASKAQLCRSALEQQLHVKQPQAPFRNITIRGTVRDWQTNMSIKNATLWLFLCDRLTASTTTDTSGNFVLSHSLQNSYAVAKIEVTAMGKQKNTRSFNVNTDIPEMSFLLENAHDTDLRPQNKYSYSSACPMDRPLSLIFILHNDPFHPMNTKISGEDFKHLAE